VCLPIDESKVGVSVKITNDKTDLNSTLVNGSSSHFLNFEQSSGVESVRICKNKSHSVCAV
jgi:hypothetical protein